MSRQPSIVQVDDDQQEEETFQVPINLIPDIQHTNGLPSVDSVSLLRRLLQDILNDEIVTLDKAENIFDAAKPESTSREYAERVKATYRTYDSLMLDIQRVEARIMKTHADRIIKEDVLDNNLQLKERVRLKREQIFMQMRKADVKKYSLIQAGDLLPEPFERAMDFRLADTDMLKLCSSASSLVQISMPLKKSASAMSQMITPIPKKRVKAVGLQDVLEADPNCVLFLNCKKGLLYKQTVKLRNISNNIARFNLNHFPKGSHFMVCWTPPPGARKFIAPGMAVALTVQYMADPYDEICTDFEINVCGGNPVKIKLLVYRDPPILNVSLFLSNYDFTAQEVMRRCTIECGSCFLGDCVTTTIPLHNIGGNGRFWICGDEGWSFAELNNLSPDNILPLLPFTISPYYFSVDAREEIEIVVTFTPSDFGAGIEELYILCDNCSVRCIELLGDGIIFTESVVEFINMEKTFAIDRDDDEECKAWLDLGTISSNGTALKTFSVANRTNLNLKYRWAKRDLQYNMLVTEDLFQMPTESYDIEPASGEIFAKDTVSFQVHCHMDSANAGKYRHALCLVLLDIPVEAVTEDSGNVVFVNTEKEGLVDLITGQVEIWVSVTKVSAVVVPSYIAITGDNLRIGSESVARDVTVINKSIDAINVVWEIPVNDPEVVKICIKPQSFTVGVGLSCTCRVLVHAVAPQEFKEKLICIINKGDLVCDTIITGDVWCPLVTSSVNELNFGIVTRCSTVHREFEIKSKSVLPALWMMKEYYYDINERQIYPRNPELSDEFGWLLCKEDKQPIKYYLETEKAGWLCFLLEISTFFNCKSMPCAYILVTANVVTPVLAIQAPIDNTAVFTICDKLYVGEAKRFPISLLNLTKTNTYFRWDTPTGSDVRKLDVLLSPYMGHVAADGDRKVQITVRPLETGNVSEFYVPCFVEYESQPIILSITCKVDCLNVTFHMPKNPYQQCFTPLDLLSCEPISWGVRGRDINYPWIAKPPKPGSEEGMSVPFPPVISEQLDKTSFDDEFMTIKELMELQVIEELQDELEGGQEQPPGETGEVDEKEQELEVEVILEPKENALENSIPEEEAPKIVHPCICHGDLENLDRNADQDEVLLEEEAACIEREKAEGQTEKFIELVPRDVILLVAPRELTVMDIDEVPVPEPIPPSDESVLGFPRTPRDSILDWLETRAVIEIDVAVCTPVNRMFVLRNETPLATEMEVTVSNFEGLYDDEDDDVDVISEVAARLAGIKPDKWSSRVNREKGLAIIVKPSHKPVFAYGVVPITVWVYADTWGFYSETIACDVKGLPVFEIKMNVRVTGLPISFPATPKGSDTIMRFGTVLFGSESAKRRLRAKNNSSVDVRVVWEIFLTDVNHEKIKEWKPFEVKLNTNLLKESSVNSLEIVKKDSNELEPLFQFVTYYGQPELNLFKMMPNEVVIPAKTEISFTVTQNTSYRAGTVTSLEHLRAVAVGRIHLDKEAEAQGDFFYRAQGDETDALAVLLEVATDVPYLSVHCAAEDFCFTVSAIHLYALPPFATITVSKTVVLKNKHDVPIHAAFQATDPFLITKLKTFEQSSQHYITIEPGNVVEVYIECRLTELNAVGTKALLAVSDDSFNVKKKPWEQSYTHVRDLTISQKDFPDQVLKLCLTITFPMLRLSVQKLDFGPVVFYETKRITFEIENMSVEPIKYWLRFKGEETCFVLEKTKGLLPSWPQPAIYIGESIGIRFTPTEPGDYCAILLVTTLASDTHQEIYVTGHGTFNQKYCRLGF